MMKKMMGQIGKGGGLLGKIPGLGKMMGGGAPDPGAMAELGMGMPTNRRAARAQKSADKRKTRKAQRKHKRRGKRR